MLQKLHNSSWFAPDKGVSVFLETEELYLPGTGGHNNLLIIYMY